MPRFCVQLDGKYFEWSTVVDSPITSPMSREEYLKWHLVEYGRIGNRDVDERLALADKHGTSCRYPPMSAKDLIAGNRAGEGETELSLEDFRAWVKGEDDV